MICVAGVSKSYGRGEAKVAALSDVTFEISSGERVALLGKSGSGKSTLLNLLGGLDTPTEGELQVAGHALHQLRPRELSRFRSRSVGMIFQSFNLIPSRTALENVLLPMVFLGFSPAERRRRGRQALEAVGLADRLNHLPSELSGGERQRVAVARAIVNQPEILLADEPTGNLDTATASDVMLTVRNHLDTHGTTLVLVTHDETIARTHTQRVLRLQDGRLL